MMDPGRGLREHGNKGIYFRGTRELRSENEGNRGTRRAHGEDADQPSLNRVFAVHSVGSHGHKMSLIRLGGCPG